MQSLKKNWLVVSNMTRGIWWIFKSPKISHWWAFYCPKYMRLELKQNRSYLHDTEQWCKIWINPGLVVSKMVRGIGWTFITVLKNLKNCIWMGSFCPKDVLARNFQRNYVSWYWRVYNAKFKGKLTCGLKNDIRNLANFRASRQKFENSCKQAKVCTLIGSFCPKHIKI